MLAAWMLYATAIGLLAGAAALAIEQLLGIWGVPRRGVWIAAMLVSVLLPLRLATRSPVRGAARPRVAAAAAAPARRAGVPRLSETMPWRLRVYRWSLQVDARTRAAWKIGSGAVALVFLAAMASMLRRRSEWRASTISGHTVFLTTDVGPAVVGILRPRIVIPEWALSLPEHERRFMLDHEREHVVAGDPKLLLFAGIALVLFPWNAALWWMTRRLRLAIEIDCDARVIRRSDAPDEYGLFLIAVGERRSHGLFLAASLAERRSSLERRIHAMTMLRPRRPILASVPFIALALGAVTLAAQTPTPPAGVAAAGAMRARTTTPPADRVHLSNDQVRALIAMHHPAVANGTSGDNSVTIVLASNGEYVASGSSKMAEAVAAAVARPTQAPPAGASASETQTARAAAVMVPREGSGQPGFMTLAGIGTVDASLVKDMYWGMYNAGDVSVNAVRVRFVTLTGNRVK